MARWYRPGTAPPDDRRERPPRPNAATLRGGESLGGAGWWVARAETGERLRCNRWTLSREGLRAGWSVEATETLTLGQRKSAGALRRPAAAGYTAGELFVSEEYLVLKILCMTIRTVSGITFALGDESDPQALEELGELHRRDIDVGTMDR